MNPVEFEQKVKRTIDEFSLVDKGDKVLVAASGGKDSTTVLYLLHKFGYNVSAIHINLGLGDWSERNARNVERFCDELGMDLYLLDFMEEFGYPLCYLQSELGRHGIKQCTVCGTLRRWLINKVARKIGATKLATGHNLDDEAETIIMNYMRGNWNSMFIPGPITGVVEDKRFVARIKPLYLTREREVIEYSRTMNFPVVYEPCPCSFRATRREFREFLNRLEKLRPSLKEELVRNYLALKNRVKYRIGGEINACEICGEPTRRRICKTCELLAKLEPRNARHC